MKFNLTKIERDDMIATMKRGEEFNLQPPEGYDNDEPDSLGDLDTNDSIVIDIEDSRDLFDELESELDSISDNELYEDDGQPTEYDEWQDLNGGDDWDHGQYDEY